MYENIKSMTGYGRAAKEFDKVRITVEIRAVNHRFFDVNIKVPKGYNFLEPAVKSALSCEILRGKTDVFISIEQAEACGDDISINEDVIMKYMTAFNNVKDKFGIYGDIVISDIIQLPEVISMKREMQDEQMITERVLDTLNDAICSFLKMREQEGKRLAHDIKAQLDSITALTEHISERAAGAVDQYREKLEKRMSDILSGIEIDSQRILTEAALFADRTAIDEELVRINSHVSQISAILSGNDRAVGKKLDFLAQELNREANTIASKANNGDIAKAVIQLKSEIEKIREQVQNIE